MSDDSFIYAFSVADLPSGKMASVQLAGQDILICHVKDEIFAVENMCSHAMAKLADGRLRAYRLICPLHGGSFDVRDGSAKGKPATAPIKTYAVRVVDGRIEIKLETD